MNFESDKVDIGTIKHVFKTDKFEPSGLDIIFDSKITYSFEEDDIVCINKIEPTSDSVIIEETIMKRLSVIKLDRPMNVTNVQVINKEFTDIRYDVIFEQKSPLEVTLFVTKTDKSKDGNHYDSIKREYSFYPVKGYYTITFVGNFTSEKNGIYKVSKSVWERIPETEETMPDVVYTIKCSAVSILNFIKIKLPYKSYPAKPVIAPEIQDDVKIVEYHYLSPDCLLINLVRNTDSASGYKENKLGANTTVYDKKIDFESRIPEFELFFDKHTIGKKNISGHQYIPLVSGIIETINWKPVSSVSIKNVFTGNLNINDKRKIDNYGEYLIGDLTVLRKQENNNENGIYRYKGDHFEKINTTGDEIDSYFLITNGDSRRKGKGIHVLGIDGYCFYTTFTGEDLVIEEPLPISPSFYKQKRSPEKDDSEPSKMETVLKTENEKNLQKLIYILFGIVIIILLLKISSKRPLPPQTLGPVQY
jgi:hypothetical protein